MAKKTLNKDNLVALGADTLADLLLDTIKGDASQQRRIRLFLSANQSPDEAASTIRKRFSNLKRATSFVDWRGQRALVSELYQIIETIEKRIAHERPNLAFDLLWALLGLSSSIHGRTDDSNGSVGGVMDYAMEAIEKIAPHLSLDTAVLADQIFDALLDNGYGEYDKAIKALSEALGDGGLDRIKSRADAFREAPITAVERERYSSIYGINRSVEEIARESRKHTLDLMLQDIADCQGDVDAWMSKYSSEQLTYRTIAPDAANRLLEAGRPEDALRIIENCIAAESKDSAWFDTPNVDHAHFACLEALGRQDDLQAALWARFDKRLCSDSLKRYLKGLPDFEDDAALELAKKTVLSHSSFYKALSFCLDWSDMDLASKVVTNSATKIDGNVYQILTPAAKRLSENHPLAAALLWRAMITFALDEKRTKRYGHAARHLASCSLADSEIDSYAPHITHEAFMELLRKQHGKKSSFWAKFDSVKA